MKPLEALLAILYVAVLFDGRVCNDCPGLKG
jgi:hypothetical protein